MNPPLKTRVFRPHLASTLHFYQEKVTERFGPVIPGEASRELARRFLLSLWAQVKQQQKTNSWQIPLTIEFAANGTFMVKVADENQILIID